MDNNERKFLHEAANPIATALFVADALLADLKTEGTASPDTVAQLDQVVQALVKTQRLLQARRTTLLQQSPAPPASLEGRKL